MLHPQTAFAVVGLLYVLLPLTAWTILHKRHDRLTVALWCVGGLLYGIAFILVGARGQIPAWLSFLVANPLLFSAYALRGCALRRELGWPAAGRAATASWIALSTAYVLTYFNYSIEAPRVFLATGVQLAGSIWLAQLAFRLYRQRGHRSAGMLAGAYLFFSIALLIREFAVLWHWEETRAMSPTFDFALAFLSGVVAALYGNLGYIGLALEAARSRDTARTAELAREQERVTQMTQRIAEQRTLLGERDQLLQQREEMLTTLAHQVRQPLNNASAALQSAAESLLRSVDDREAAGIRVQRASAVLTNVTATLDNNLADAVLLNDQEPAGRQEIELDLLAGLVLADIPTPSRGRVRYQRATTTRTAVLNPGLMRLALRNLLTNSLAYSPDESPVLLTVSDTDEPLELIIEVRDQGPGISAELMPRLFTRGARGSGPLSGHGLGLYIVRKVMNMHRGHVEVIANPEHGITMRLRIPQEYSD